MEERITLLEMQVKALYEVIQAQQEAIDALNNCMDGLIKQEEHGVKTDMMLFEYCKGLRKELEKVKH